MKFITDEEVCANSIYTKLVGQATYSEDPVDGQRESFPYADQVDGDPYEGGDEAENYDEQEP